MRNGKWIIALALVLLFVPCASAALPNFAKDPLTGSSVGCDQAETPHESEPSYRESYPISPSPARTPEGGQPQIIRAAAAATEDMQKECKGKHHRENGRDSVGEIITGLLEDIAEIAKPALSIVHSGITGKQAEGDDAGKFEEQIETIAVNKLPESPVVVIPLIVSIGLGLAFELLSKITLVPSHSNIRNSDLLENENRKLIYELIKARPGICMKEISEITMIGWSSVVYHVSTLTQRDFVVASMQGRRRHLFENSRTYRPDQKKYIIASKNDAAYSIMNFIRDNPGCTQKEVSETLCISTSLVSWHIGRLEKMGLVQKSREGRSNRCQIACGSNPRNTVQAIMAPA